MSEVKAKPEPTRYRSHEIVEATEMTLGDYRIHTEVEIGEDEDPDAEGYLVEHVSGEEEPNHPEHDDYISWMPKALFDANYNEVI